MFSTTSAAVGDGVGPLVDGATVEVGAGAAVAIGDGAVVTATVGAAVAGDGTGALALAIVAACGVVQAPSADARATAAISPRMSRD